VTSEAPPRKPSGTFRLLNSTCLHAREVWESKARASRPKRRRRLFCPVPALLSGSSKTCAQQGDLPKAATVAPKALLLGTPKAGMSCWFHRRTATGLSDLRVPSLSPRMNVHEQHGPIRAIFWHPLVCDASNDRAFGIKRARSEIKRGCETAMVGGTLVSLGESLTRDSFVLHSELHQLYHF